MSFTIGVLEVCLPVFVDGVMCNGKPLRYVAQCIRTYSVESKKVLLAK